MEISSSLSVISPVLNEGRTIASIVQILRTWGRAREIIVVNDEATTDDTERILKRFGTAITVIRNNKGKGKGDAVATGIAKAKGEILMCIDGDLTSLTHRDLDTLLRPIVNNRADMAIGALRYWHAGDYEPFNTISGTRVFWRKNVISHLSEIKKSGYGVEILLNTIHKGKRIRYIRLPYVFVLNKFEKQSTREALNSYLREAWELVAESIRRTGDMSPQVKPILRDIQRYIKTAFDYLQLE